MCKRIGSAGMTDQLQERGKGCLLYPLSYPFETWLKHRRTTDLATFHQLPNHDISNFVRNYLVDSAERCFFAVGKVMFKGDEHKFKAHEHMFKGGEHKFMGREHKIISV